MVIFNKITSCVLVCLSALAVTMTPLHAQAGPPSQPRIFTETVTPPPGGSVLIFPGDRVESRDGRFRLLIQNDGNLVLFDRGSRIWDAGVRQTRQTITLPGSAGLKVTLLTKGCFAAMQSDGNLVVYGSTGVDEPVPGVCQANPNPTPGGSIALWSSRTNGNPNSRLVVQTDGNTVIYTPSNNAVWATDTCCR